MAAAEWSGAIRLLAPDGTNVLATLASGDTSSSALAFSPDGKTLATSSGNQAILLFDSHTGRQEEELRGHRGKIRALAYDWDSSQILDSSSLVKKASLTGVAALFSPDGSQLAALVPSGVGAEFILRRVDAGSNRAIIHADSAGLDLVTTELSPDGAFASFTTYARALVSGSLLCDAFSGEKILSVTNSLGCVGHCFLPDGSAWGYMDGSKIRFWDLRSRQNTRSFDCHKVVTRLAISADGKVLAAGRKDYSILLWDLVTGAELGSLAGHQAEVWALALSQQTLSAHAMPTRLVDSGLNFALRKIFNKQNSMQQQHKNFDPAC